LRYYVGLGEKIVMPTEAAPLTAEENAEENTESSKLNKIKMVGWLSVGMAAVALGVIVGRELRSRYKFNRRTPYDFYARADEKTGEFGVGI
jgi:hypothetical protein